MRHLRHMSMIEHWLRKHECRARQRGLTLIEVMVSLFVLSMIALIFVGTVSASMRACYLNGEYAQATSLCQHKIDQLRAVGFGRLNYSELSDAGIVDPNPRTSPYAFTQADNVRDYLPEASTSLAIDSVPGNSQVMKVTATISWKSVTYENRNSTMSLCALIANVE